MTRRPSRLGRLLDDLMDRRIVRVATIYVIVAFAVVMLADLAASVGLLPITTTLFLLPLALFAFPVVLAVVWILDGSEESASLPASPTRPASSRPVPPAHHPGPGIGTDAGSVAVLPFQVTNATADADAVAVGLHADLITALARTTGLSVIARHSARYYRHTRIPTADIARELDVGTVLEGTLEISGGRIRLSAQLFDAARDSYRWADRDDRILSPEGIAEIRQDLVQRIVASVHSHGDVDARRVPRNAGPAPTESLEAYRSWARGRARLDERTREGLLGALVAFRSAAEADPAYARAWAGIAQAQAFLRWYGHAVPEGAPEAGEAVRRALELDPELSAAHTTLGVLHLMEQDGPGALEALSRARALGPSDDDALSWFCWARLVMGTPEEAVEAARTGLRLSPHSTRMQIAGSAALLALGRFQEACDHAQWALRLDPDNGLAHYMAGLASYHLHDFAATREALDRALPLISSAGVSPRPSGVRAVAGLVHVATGDPLQAASELKELGHEAGAAEQDGVDAPADLFAIGLLHLGMGDTDLAIDLFRRVERWGPLLTVEVRHLYPDLLGSIRKEDRFRRVEEAVRASWTPESR